MFASEKMPNKVRLYLLFGSVTRPMSTNKPYDVTVLFIDLRRQTYIKIGWDFGSQWFSQSQSRLAADSRTWQIMRLHKWQMPEPGIISGRWNSYTDHHRLTLDHSHLVILLFWHCQVAGARTSHACSSCSKTGRNLNSICMYSGYLYFVRLTSHWKYCYNK